MPKTAEETAISTESIRQMTREGREKLNSATAEERVKGYQRALARINNAGNGHALVTCKF